MSELIVVVGVLFSWVSIFGFAYTTGYDHAKEDHQDSRQAGDSV